MAENVRKMSGFKWSVKRTAAALLLAEGHTQEEVARLAGITDRTIRRWMAAQEFGAEVDRLSQSIKIARCAERLRIAHRAVRQKVKDGVIDTDKDVLDWLKYVRSETEGIRLGLAHDLLALLSRHIPSLQTGAVDNL